MIIVTTIRTYTSLFITLTLSCYYIILHVLISLSLYIYIYIEREREREREMYVSLSLYIYIYRFISIFLVQYYEKYYSQDLGAVEREVPAEYAYMFWSHGHNTQQLLRLYVCMKTIILTIMLYIYLCVCIHVRVCIYIYIYSYTHTCIHTWYVCM